MLLATSRVTALAALVAAGGAAPPPVFAQPAAELPPVVVGGTRPTTTQALDEAVETSSRLGVPAREIPASVEVIDQEAIRDRGKRTVSEALEGATGFTVGVPGGAPGVLSVRGFTGNGVRHLYDGIAIGSATMTTRPGDTFNLERIEILRGPASVLYGEGALGAVVNFVTKAPTRTRQPVDVQVGAGNYNAVRGGIGVGGPIGDSPLSYRFDASHQRFDTFQRGNEHRYDRLTGALRWDMTQRLAVTFAADWQRDAQQDAYWGTPLVDGRIDARLREVNYNNLTDNRFRAESRLLRANVDWRATDRWTVRNVAYSYDAYRDWRNAEIFTANASAVPLTVTRASFGDLDHRQTVLGNRLDAAHRGTLFGLGNRFVIGAEAVRTDFVSGRNGFPGTQTVDAFDPPAVAFNAVTAVNRSPARDVRITHWALFAENQLALTPRLKVIGGLRHDSIDADFLFLDAGGARRERHYAPNSGRLGVTFDVAPALTLYGQYTNATEPVGTFFLLNAATSQLNLTRGRMTEIGLKSQFWNRRGEATLALYEIDKRDILTRDPANPANSIAVGRQSSRGVEFAFGVLAGAALRVEGNLAALRARFDDFAEAQGATLVSRSGNTPPDVPEIVANLGARYRVLPRLELGGWGRHVGRRFTNNANTIVMPAYTTLDLAATWRFDRNHALSLWVRNATDKVYAQWTGASVNQVILGAPRTVEMVFNARF